MSTVVQHPYIAVVLHNAELAKHSIGGLTVTERAIRVTKRVGIATTCLVSTPAEAAHAAQVIAASPARVMVIDCTSQIIHMPLLSPLLDNADDASSMSVAPSTQRYAGAMLCDDQLREALLRLLNSEFESPRAAQQWSAVVEQHAGIKKHQHGEIACHPIATAEQRRSAIHFLFGLVRKAQDTPLIRLVNRRVSYPFTRLLLPTRITPNLISIVVFLIGALGCWFISTPSYASAVSGTLLVLFAGYLDGCDGEIARIRIESSKLGAWIDTIADETTTILFLIAAGLHAYGRLGDEWILWTIAAGSLAAMLCVYVIYYYLIVVAKSGNSQDYPAGASSGIVGVLRLVVKRDFINLTAVVFALANQMTVMYFLTLVGAIVSAAILTPQHVMLRITRRRNRNAARTEPRGNSI